MKKKIWIMAASILAVLMIGYCIMGNPSIAYHNHCLKQSIRAISKTEATLNEIVPFEWDTVYTFPPYTSRAEIEKTIGFKSSSIKETVSEGMVQLLFVKDRKLSGSVCGYAENLGYRIEFRDKVEYKENAVFVVSREEDIVLLKKR